RYGPTSRTPQDVRDSTPSHATEDQGLIVHTQAGYGVQFVSETSSPQYDRYAPESAPDRSSEDDRQLRANTRDSRNPEVGRYGQREDTGQSNRYERDDRYGRDSRYGADDRHVEREQNSQGLAPNERMQASQETEPSTPLVALNPLARYVLLHQPVMDQHVSPY